MVFASKSESRAEMREADAHFGGIWVEEEEERKLSIVKQDRSL